MKEFGIMDKLRNSYIKIMWTILTLWIYGVIWIGLEFIIYGEITNRLVDNIMLVLMIPIIWKSIKIDENKE